MQILDSEILNRVSIILNFIGGCLLAPEIVGRKRVEWLEQRLETLAWIVTAILRGERIERQGKTTASDSFRMWGFVVILQVGFWGFIQTKISAGLIAALISTTLIITVLLIARAESVVKSLMMMQIEAPAGAERRRHTTLFRILTPESIASVLLHILVLYGFGISGWVILAATIEVWMLSRLLVDESASRLLMERTKLTRVFAIVVSSIKTLPYVQVFGLMILAVIFFSPLLLVTSQLSSFALRIMDPAQYRLHAWVKAIGVASFVLGNLLLVAITFTG